MTPWQASLLFRPHPHAGLPIVHKLHAGTLHNAGHLPDRVCPGLDGPVVVVRSVGEGHGADGEASSSRRLRGWYALRVEYKFNTRAGALNDVAYAPPASRSAPASSEGMARLRLLELVDDLDKKHGAPSEALRAEVDADARRLFLR